MDCITLKDLKFHARHGYFDEERQKGNDFEVDIFFWLDLHPAAASDNLAETVDYGNVVDIVRRIMDGNPVNLIETLLYSIGETLSENYPQVKKIEVAVRKMHPPMNTACTFAEVRSQWPR